MKRILMALGVVCFAGSVAVADRVDVASPRVQDVLERLDSDSFGEREAAQAELAEVFAGDLNGLFEVVREKNLSSEQRMRVLRLARQQFVSTPRGAIGISMRVAPGNEWLGTGVQIAETMRDFPVHTMGQLLAGDVLLELGDTDLTEDEASQGLRREVISRDAGEKVRVKLLRPAIYNADNPPNTDDELIAPEEIEQLITLGAWGNLSNPGVNQQVTTNRLRDAELEGAWFLRLEREGISTRNDAATLSTRTSKKAIASTRGVQSYPLPKFFISADSPRAVAFGAAGVQNQLKREALVGREPRVNRSMHAPEDVRVVPLDPDDEQNEPAMVEAANLQKFLAALQEQEARLRRQAGDSDLPAMERELIRDELQTLVAKREQLEAQIRRIGVRAANADDEKK